MRGHFLVYFLVGTVPLSTLYLDPSRRLSVWESAVYPALEDRLRGRAKTRANGAQEPATDLIPPLTQLLRTPASSPASQAESELYETSVSCVGTSAPQRSCHYKNLYWDSSRASFLMLVMNTSPISRMTPGELRRKFAAWSLNRYGGTLLPQVQVFNTTEDLRAKARGLTLGTGKGNYYEAHGVGLYLTFLYTGNIGHALFDNLYPAFVASLKFGRQDQPFHIVANDEREQCMVGVEKSEGAPSSGMAYWPDPTRRSNHSVWPIKVRILQRWPEKVNCSFREGVATSAVELAKFPLFEETLEGLDAQCCRLCHFNQRCKSAVVHLGTCSLKAACQKRCDKGGPCESECHTQQERSRLCAKEGADTYQEVENSAGERAWIPTKWLVDDTAHCFEASLRRFSMPEKGGSTSMLTSLKRESAADKDWIMRFPEFIVGSGTVGNLPLDPSVTVGYSGAPYHGTSRFRDRMLRTHDVEPRPAGSIAGKRKPKVIIVDNKRFLETEQQTLRSVAKALTLEGRADVDYIRWPELGNFSQHMGVVNEVDVYVSGPGTALQYAPFMRDGSVFVALGTKLDRDGRTVPAFMEQQLVGGGTPYLRTLYREQPHLEISSSDSTALINQAVDLVLSGSALAGVESARDNLSVEGKILEEYCRLDEWTCKLTVSLMWFPIQQACFVDNWPECIVYEVGGYSESAVGTQRCPMNRSLIRSLRRKYGVSGYGIPNEDTLPASEQEQRESWTGRWNDWASWEVSFGTLDTGRAPRAALVNWTRPQSTQMK
mmetsp:Transcript_49417/g.105202  ORF Transcript_49417/g.105202 Transcript_49417/m.105202 type:complete len:773 (-) Transcript_49417:382-2700(-)|eukprot:CAMPEP_0206457200 /NCGR_PEP_ID=MMETSP0324_2-20121206/22819_1 /ASSEMBLY_ACC=CAM_ASM_000836 /TAXON_ID=2866 /ORGANISM="Crypthecodinium cohnii, Strain Seligo" /LENGTH=772 /DNA_ID=CAMNT_0053928275 /DNA_START=58 /DNA_END=2376 /DNA_ORIENTATION=+